MECIPSCLCVQKPQLPTGGRGKPLPYIKKNLPVGRFFF